MSFPIPYKRFRFIGLGQLRIFRVSAANTEELIDYSDNPLLTCPEDRFRLLFVAKVRVVVTTDGSTDIRWSVEPKGELKYYRYLVYRDGQATEHFDCPMGDANVSPKEIQLSPIPWFPNETMRIESTAAGAGKTVELDVYMRWLEWEILSK